MNSQTNNEKEEDRLKNAEKKIFCICIDVYKIYEGIDFNEILKVLSKLKKTGNKHQYYLI